MPSVSGWVLRLFTIILAVMALVFLCPRCRAGYCDGCLSAVAVACVFGVRFAILSVRVPGGQAFRVWFPAGRR
jgi:hypothetical protein